MAKPIKKKKVKVAKEIDNREICADCGERKAKFEVEEQIYCYPLDKKTGEAKYHDEEHFQNSNGDFGSKQICATCFDWEYGSDYCGGEDLEELKEKELEEGGK